MEKLGAVALVAGLGMFSTACGSDVSVAAARSSLVVSPSMVDLGNVTVGESVTIDLQLDLSGAGTIQFVGVEVHNVAGTFFSAEASDLSSISPGTSEQLRLLYEPQEEGFHWATALT